MNKPDTITNSAAYAKSLDLILRCLPAYVMVSDEKLRFTAIRGATLRHIGIDEAEIAKKIGTPLDESFTGEAGFQFLSTPQDALPKLKSKHRVEDGLIVIGRRRIRF